MAEAKCPDCGSEELYRHVNTAANGWTVRLLPKLMPGRFTVVLCGNCGLTRFYASHADRESARVGWERLQASQHPLSL
jgi:predicted nucleic-acid-binding Zn-ribbon protein